VGGRKTFRVAEAYSTKDGSKFDQLTSIPVATSGLCLVIVDDDTLFIAGGDTNSGRSKGVFVYSKNR
jgi:sugar/nucleoside kinase (ribokinase family)